MARRSWTSSLFAVILLIVLGAILVAEARPYSDIFTSGLLINPQGGSYFDFTGDRRPPYDPEVLTNTGTAHFFATS